MVDNLGGGFIRNHFGEVLEGGRLKTSLRKLGSIRIKLRII